MQNLCVINTEIQFSYEFVVKPPYWIYASNIFKKKIHIGSQSYLIKYTSKHVYTKFHASITKWTIIQLMASIIVHHFIAISEFKLELQSGNAQFGSNSTIFLAMWPWNLTDDLEKQ